jgi:hypothetical protein
MSYTKEQSISNELINNLMRFWVLSAVKIKVMILWLIIQWSFVNGYQYFG